jgi:shikimate kinase
MLLKGLNLYLIGMMGAGKSTVGKILAERLNYHFFDTDTVIEQASGQAITEIFASLGETAFRELETQVLAELSAYTKLVVATGGGIVLQRKNWSHLRQGLIVWLNVPLEQLYDRLRGDTVRPLLQGEKPEEKLRLILEQRQALYSQADLCITPRPEESPEQLATRILQQIPAILKPEPIPTHRTEN